MTNLQAIGFTAVGGSVVGLTCTFVFGIAVFKRNTNVAPRCTARPRDTIYAKHPKNKWQQRGNPFLGWICWTLKLSYDTMLRGIPGTGTRKNGMAGKMLDVNLDGIIMLRFHALCLRVVCATCILALGVILPINLTAQCFSSYQLDPDCTDPNKDNVNLTNYERTTLANIPPLTSVASPTAQAPGEAGVFNIFKTAIWGGYPYANLLFRMYTIVLCSWLVFWFACHSLRNEWKEALALRRVYYLENDMWGRRKKELETTVYLPELAGAEDDDWSSSSSHSSSDEGDDLDDQIESMEKGNGSAGRSSTLKQRKGAVNSHPQRRGKKIKERRKKRQRQREGNRNRHNRNRINGERDPWIPHPEQRETTPNVELYSVLVGELPCLPSEVVSESTDMESAIGFSRSQAIDWQLAVVSTFFNHCVPNQPGFSSSVAAVTILPDAPALARAWRRWYAAAAALRRLRFIRTLISDLRHYDISDDDEDDYDGDAGGEADKTNSGVLNRQTGNANDAVLTPPTVGQLHSRQLTTITAEWWNQNQGTMAGQQFLQTTNTAAGVNMGQLDAVDTGGDGEPESRYNESVGDTPAFSATVGGAFSVSGTNNNMANAPEPSKGPVLSPTATLRTANVDPTERAKQALTYYRAVFGADDNLDVESHFFQALNFGPEQTAVYSRELAQGAANCCPNGCGESRLRKQMRIDELVQMEREAVVRVHNANIALQYAQARAAVSVLDNPAGTKKAVEEDQGLNGKAYIDVVAKNEAAGELSPKRKPKGHRRAASWSPKKTSVLTPTMSFGKGSGDVLDSGNAFTAKGHARKATNSDFILPESLEMEAQLLARETLKPGAKVVDATPPMGNMRKGTLTNLQRPPPPPPPPALIRDRPPALMSAMGRRSQSVGWNLGSGSLSSDGDNETDATKNANAKEQQQGCNNSSLPTRHFPPRLQTLPENNNSSSRLDVSDASHTSYNRALNLPPNYGASLATSAYPAQNMNEIKPSSVISSYTTGEHTDVSRPMGAKQDVVNGTERAEQHIDQTSLNLSQPFHHQDHEFGRRRPRALTSESNSSLLSNGTVNTAGGQQSRWGNVVLDSEGKFALRRSHAQQQQQQFRNGGQTINNDRQSFQWNEQPLGSHSTLSGDVGDGQWRNSSVRGLPLSTIRDHSCDVTSNETSGDDFGVDGTEHGIVMGDNANSPLPGEGDGWTNGQANQGTTNNLTRRKNRRSTQSTIEDNYSHDLIGLNQPPSDQWKQVERICAASPDPFSAAQSFANHMGGTAKPPDQASSINSHSYESNFNHFDDGVWNMPDPYTAALETRDTFWKVMGRCCSRFTGRVAVGTTKVVDEIKSNSTYAVVTFTNRQAAVAARHLLADGRGASRWVAVERLPVPPLADAASCDLVTCRGCCRPVTLTLNKNQQLMRKFFAISLLVVIYIFYTFPITFASSLIKPEKLYEVFPGLEELVKSNPFFNELLSGIVPAALYVLFFALCPLMFKAIANSGSNATSVVDAESSALSYYWWFMVITAFSGSSIMTMVLQTINQGRLGVTLAQVLVEIAQTVPTQVSAAWINWIILRTTMVLPNQYLLQTNTFLFGCLGWNCCQRAVMGGGPGGCIPYRIYVDSGVVFMCTVALSFASPLVAPCALFYFLLCAPLWRRNCIYIYRPKFDGGGLRWPFLFDVCITSMVVGQILLTTMMVLKEAIGPAIMAAFAAPPTLLFRSMCRKQFLRAYEDAGLLQTSLLDEWDSTVPTCTEKREEFRRFLVDSHKAAYIPVCIAGDATSVLTAEPAVVVPLEYDEQVTDSSDVNEVFQPDQQSASFRQHAYPQCSSTSTSTFRINANRTQQEVASGI